MTSAENASRPLRNVTPTAKRWSAKPDGTTSESKHATIMALLRDGPEEARAVKMADRHEVEIRLNYGYPRAAPDVRWLTPIFHPNVSFSGFIHLRDIGLPWEPTVQLSQV